MKIAVYAGSFDPVTLGHVDLVLRASKMFDKVIVAMGKNSAKTSFLPETVRLELLREECKDIPRVEVTSFDGLLIKYCQSVKSKFMIRGLRALTDFEYELGIAHANWTQDTNVETVFLPTHPDLSFVSSSTVRELVKHGGKVEKYVSKRVEAALKEAISHR